MKTTYSMILGLALLAGLSACQASPTPSLPAATVSPQPAPTAAATMTAVPEVTPPPAAGAVSDDIAGLKSIVGYDVRAPRALPGGYVLEKASAEAATRSVCLQYRHSEASDSILWIAQGPGALTPPLEAVAGWPDYAVLRQEVKIGGAQNGLSLLGWRRRAWACAGFAENEKTPFSFALAPRLAWQAGDMQFEIYSASGGCATPGGLTHLDLLRLAEDLTGTSTHPASELDPECLHSVADAKTLSGIEVKAPGYLPQDVVFYFATYESDPGVVHSQFLHQQHSQSGRFFQISQYKEAPPFYMSSCAGAASGSCEVLKIDGVPVVYQYLNPTEQLDWSAGGYYFSLFRNAGEPGKVYKDELVKIIASMR